MEQTKKLRSKDLIVAGAFAALYLAVMLAVVTAASVTPVTFLLAPFLSGIVLGTIYILYCVKIPRRGAILILGVPVSLALITTTWVAPLWGMACALAAELLASAGKYQSKKWYTASFCAFACTTAGPFWALLTSKPAIMEENTAYYGAQYAAVFDAITPPWITPVAIASAILGGFIGAAVGKKLLKKHFEKAGVV